MFTRFATAYDTLADISRVECLVRDRFGVGPSELVLVSQDRATKPGYPPLETNVAFWKGEKRYRLKIFSPVADVTDADLPVGWLLPALEDNGDAGCC